MKPRLIATTLVTMSVAICACGSPDDSDLRPLPPSKPEPGCDLDCGSGVCAVDLEGFTSCLCPSGFQGSRCDACDVGFFGADCAACPCDHGVCDEGVDGSGVCNCEDGWEGDLCDTESPFRVPFQSGPYGTDIMSVASDFSLGTTAGTMQFSEHWTGDDSYIFVLKYGESAYNTDVWQSDVGLLLQLSEENVHIVFMSFDEGAEAAVSEMESRVNDALALMSSELAAHWSDRVHYVPDRLFDPATGWGISAGGLKDFIEAHGYFWFAIDRFQRWREIGSLHDWQSNTSPMGYIGHETTAFNYEAAVVDRMDKLHATRVVLFEQGAHQGGWAAGHGTSTTVTLPDPEILAGFDAMALYLYTACPTHQQGKDNGCNEWDYIQNLVICDRTVPADGWESEGACAPEDTLNCSCVLPGGEVVPSVHTCNEEGTGFGDCSCSCDTEFARWVTPYGREGRWLTDLDPLLSLVRDGGERRFVFRGANGYTVDLELLLYDSGRGEHPMGHRYLWGNPGGTSFNETYNDGRHPDVIFEVPPGTTGVVLMAVISGHGHSSTTENCAEFCNHQHEFTINGEVLIRDHPVAGVSYGCRDQMADGVVANQFGTWPYGRGGWCAGMDVKPWVQDLTPFVVEGENTLSYRGLYQGLNYTPHPSGGGDYMPEVKMTSWLVFYGPDASGEE